MATTLEIYDGSTILDLLDGTAYSALHEQVRTLSFAPPTRDFRTQGGSISDISFEARRVAIPLDILGTSTADLLVNIRALERMIRRTEYRRRLDEGVTKVVLRYQQGNTDADDIDIRILAGSLVYDPNVLQDLDISTNNRVRTTLELTLEPFGRMSDITYAPITLENEQDGDNTNYLDLAGAFGSRLTFDGVSGDVTVTDQAAIQNVFDGGGCVTFRFKANSDGESDLGHIISKGVNSWGVWVANESGGAMDLRFFLDFSTDFGSWSTSSRLVTVGQDYFVAIVYDSDATGNDPTIYLIPINGVDSLGTTSVLTVGDGLDESSTPAGARLDDTGDDLFFGNRTGDDRTFDGDIDDVSLWTATRTQAQLESQAANELVGTETNLAGYWPMDENTGSTAHDVTSNGNDGTITSATWTIDDDLKGNAGAWLQVKLEDANNGGGNAWNGSKRVWVGIKSGERRSDDLFLEAADSINQGTDPSDTDGGTFSSSVNAGDFSTNASGGDSAEMQWIGDAGGSNLDANVFLDCGNAQYDISTLPEGLYRVLARVAYDADGMTTNPDDSEMGFALGHVFGGTTTSPTVNDFVAFGDSGDNNVDTWKILDLGELNIPPIQTPDDFTDPTLNLRIHACGNNFGAQSFNNADSLEWYVDFVFLMPIDEGFFVVDSADTNDVILGDHTADTPGIWFMNTSDVVQSIPDRNGAPIALGPEATRIYWLRDDTGDPSTIQGKLTAKYTPLVQGV